jgi:divalent metal cation (Fe/Co/Zn/Cd) transporter
VFKGITTTFSDMARLDPREVAAKISTFEGVRDSHNIRTRGTGAVVHMDLSVLVDPDITVAEAHVIARDLEAWLCGQYPGLKDVVVHVEPDTEEQRSRSLLCGGDGA